MLSFYSPYFLLQFDLDKRHFQAQHLSSIMLLIHLLNGDVSSKNIDNRVSCSIAALRKSFGVTEFPKQVGYAKKEMHRKLRAV